jgi:hypothetical protein
MEKIKIRGLLHAAGWIFLVWGLTAALKGLWDFRFGEPEANLYSAHKWEFVTKAQWLKWAVFEMIYGVSCALIALALKEYSKRVPEYIERKAAG